MSPAAGMFLVAAPHLGDPNFMRSVVYLLRHGEDGSMGLIVNRPLPMPLSEIWDETPEGLRDAQVVAEGGPVDRHQGLLLHGDPSLPGCQPLAADLAIGGERAALAVRYARGPDGSGPRLFLGYAGWGPGQLAEEIAEGAWLLRPGSALHVVMAPDHDLWQRLLAGGSAVGPPAPSLN
ncbi:MAG: YqgE/AlgH family protein [Planctomycetota bacterium]|nr:YqgE/AlgH family protein [Planctomycetota bacterium]MCX8039047.1 YqgE/AlgH family protein [Planctomycetota bacterium]MDW8372697.1 YqgE/AlgH family protein [Planctomycetota bacterium]